MSADLTEKRWPSSLLYVGKRLSTADVFSSPKFQQIIFFFKKF
jgi:hypothetical protein